MFKFANHRRKELFVSTANKPLVGTLMTIGDVTVNIAIPFCSCTRHRSFCQIRPYSSFHTDIVIEIIWLHNKERWFNSLQLQLDKSWSRKTRIQQSLVQDNRSLTFVTQWNWVNRIPNKGKICSVVIYNGNRTEWSPIQSVIIRVINKIGRPRSGSPIC